MISTRKELQFYIMADMIMNRGKNRWSLSDRIKHLFLPDLIMSYLKAMRYTSYYGHRKDSRMMYLPLWAWHCRRYRRLGVRLGFSIGCDTLGYGTVISHYGTIVVGETNRLGNYAVLHTSTCISDNGKRIGDALYLATGAKITSCATLGDNVSVGANSLVNKSFGSGLLIAGMPAKAIKGSEAWYVRDGESYYRRVKMVEELKKSSRL